MEATAGRCATHMRTGDRVHSYCLALIDAASLELDSRGRCGRTELRRAFRSDQVQTNSETQIRLWRSAVQRLSERSPTLLSICGTRSAGSVALVRCAVVESSWLMVKLGQTAGD